MADFITNNDLKQAFNSSWPYDEFECDLCHHGGRCKLTSLTTYEYQCLCPIGYTGDRCQDTVVDDFVVSDNPQSINSGLTTGLTVGACLVILIAAIAFFLWRKQSNTSEIVEKEIQTNRMKKMSIEGMSIVGEKPVVKRTPIPVCIAIEKEYMGQDHIALSLGEDNNSHTNPLNPREQEQKTYESKNPIVLV